MRSLVRDIEEKIFCIYKIFCIPLNEGLVRDIEENEVVSNDARLAHRLCLHPSSWKAVQKPPGFGVRLSSGLD